MAPQSNSRRHQECPALFLEAVRDPDNASYQDLLALAPSGFLSIVGGILLLAYACWRRDPVFILGQSTGLIVYTRNLVLLRRSRRKALQADA